MPNWRFNQLMVTGPADDVGSLLASVDDRANPGWALRTALSLRRIVPMPAELEQQTENPKGEPVGDRYDWCIAHWGAKWDVVAVLTDELDLEGTQTLMSASTRPGARPSKPSAHWPRASPRASSRCRSPSRAATSRASTSGRAAPSDRDAKVG